MGLKAKHFKEKYEPKLGFSDRWQGVGKGVGVQTQRSHCGWGMDIFWNDTLYQSVRGVGLSAAGSVSITGLHCIPIATATKIWVRYTH